MIPAILADNSIFKLGQAIFVPSAHFYDAYKSITKLDQLGRIVDTRRMALTLIGNEYILSGNGEMLPVAKCYGDINAAVADAIQTRKQIREKLKYATARVDNSINDLQHITIGLFDQSPVV